MKPFNLEKALAGEPVKLRNGKKAFVLKQIEAIEGRTIIGYIWYREEHQVPVNWYRNGLRKKDGSARPDDIVGMWQEPREQVTITIPAPLKYYPRNGEEYWVVDDTEIKKKIWENAHVDYIEFDESFAFPTEEDAEAFLDAIQGARR